MFNLSRLACGLSLSLATLIAGSVLALAQSEAELYEAAKKEGEINWYTGLVQNQLVRPVVAAFEAKYPGVRINITSGRDTDLMVKFQAEAKAGKLQADLTEGPSVVNPLKEIGLVELYVPEAAAKLAPQHKDPNGEWTAALLHFLVPAVNTEQVKAGDEPKTLDDLLDPKWKGRMAWSGEMTLGGPPGFIGAVLNALGEEKGMAYLEKLSRQNIATIPSNPRAVLDQVIAGQYAIALVTYSHHSVISAGKGAPVKWLPISPAVGAMGREVLLKGGPHPNGAKLLINFLISPAGQEVIREAGYIPANPDVQPKEPSLKPEVSGFKVFAPTPAEEARDIGKWIAVYKKLFQ